MYKRKNKGKVEKKIHLEEEEEETTLKVHNFESVTRATPRQIQFNPRRETRRVSLLVKNVYNNPFVYLNVFGSLTGALDELFIMGKTNQTRKLSVNLKRLSLAEKYGEVYHSTLYNFQTMQQKNDEYLGQLNLENLEKARLFVEKTLQISTLELVKSRKTHTIVEIIDGYYDSLQEDETFLESVRNRHKLVSQLKTQLSTTRKDLMGKIQLAVEKIGHLKDELETITDSKGLQERYVTNWENSRTEKHEMIVRRQESDIKDTSLEFRHKIFTENRVHAEIRRYFGNFEQDAQKRMEEWKEKYAGDLESFEEKIVSGRNERESKKVALEDLRALHKKRQQDVLDYLEYKEAKRKEAEALARLNRAATKIQAWWRGTMYRRRLGPYRKKKGKKSPNDGKKGSKKK